MYTVFGDESHDPTRKKVFAVSGVLATQEEWDEFEVKWLERTNGQVIHSADLQGGYGDFKNIPHEVREKLYRDLIGIIADSTLIGFGIVTDIEAYKTVYTDAPDYAPYVHCFRRVIEYFAELGGRLIPQDKINFRFHVNTRMEQTASNLFYEYRKRTDWEHGVYLNDIGFISSETVGIQVADLYARELMKFGDRNFDKPKDETFIMSFRKSFKVLADTGKFGGDFFGREYWDDYKKHFPEIIKTAGFSEHDLAVWLSDNRLADNGPNRTRFFAHINEIDRQQEIKKENVDTDENANEKQ